MRTIRSSATTHPSSASWSPCCAASDRHRAIPIKITIRVRPGASRTRVGGNHDDALVVAVSEPPVDGRATAAALKAVSKALGCRPRDIELVRGSNSRTKIIDIPDDLGPLVDELRRD